MASLRSSSHHRTYLYLKEFNINVRHIESRKSRRKTSQYEIYVDIDCEDKEKMNILLHHLRYWILLKQNELKFK